MFQASKLRRTDSLFGLGFGWRSAYSPLISTLPSVPALQFVERFKNVCTAGRAALQGRVSCWKMNSGFSPGGRLLFTNLSFSAARLATDVTWHCASTFSANCFNRQLRKRLAEKLGLIRNNPINTHCPVAFHPRCVVHRPDEHLLSSLINVFVDSGGQKVFACDHVVDRKRRTVTECSFLFADQPQRN